MTIENFLMKESESGLKAGLEEFIDKNPEVKTKLGKNYDILEKVIDYTRTRYKPLSNKKGKIVDLFQGLGSIEQAASLHYANTTGDFINSTYGYLTGTIFKMPAFLGEFVDEVKTYDPAIIGLKTLSGLADLAIPGGNWGKRALEKLLPKKMEDFVKYRIMNKAKDKLLKELRIKEPLYKKIFNNARNYHSNIKNEIQTRSKNIIDPNYTLVPNT